MTARNHDLAKTLTGASTPDHMISLEDLWARAESYGRVNAHSSEDASSRDNSYHVYIKFETTNGIILEAASGFELPLRTALEQAMARAEAIRGQFK